MSYAQRNVYPPCPQTERGKPTHLGGDPKNGEDILYCSGQVVVVRNLNDPLNCYLYKRHQSPVTVARYSPSGYYIASADTSGKIRIWDTVNEEHITTFEKDSIGTIEDMAWSADSKRILVGGKGNQFMGEAFFADSGSSVGSISGHAQPVLSCDMKPTRPFRCATGSEDRSVNIYPGPPFKFSHSLREHNKYVNCVRYSPDGSKLITVSSDKRALMFEGKDTELLGELDPDNAHGGSIYSVSWSDDSQRVITCSADKTARIWDANTYELLQTFAFPNKTEYFQVGSLWQGENIITLNLGGDLTYLDEGNPDQPLRVLHGHSRRIVSFVLEPTSNRMFSTDVTGRTVEWLEGTSETRLFPEVLINGTVNTKLSEGRLFAAGTSGTLAVADIDSLEQLYTVDVEVCPVDFVPCGDWVAILLDDDSLVFVNGEEVANKVQLDYRPTCIDTNPDGTLIAIGGFDGVARVYQRNGFDIELDYKIENRHTNRITQIQFSPNGQYLATGGADNLAYCFEGTVAKTKRWAYHISPIATLAWCPDSEHVATGGLDGTIFIWSVPRQGKKIKMDNAHLGQITQVGWLDQTTLVSSGDQGSITTWDITHW